MNVTYEYLTLNIRKDLKTLYMNCYKSLGWAVSEDKKDYFLNSKYINKDLKRNANIIEKDKLNKLQEQSQEIFSNIEKLLNEPKSVATKYAILISIIGTIFLAISVFTITLITPFIWQLFAICGIIGMVGWILPYFIYKNIFKKKCEENDIRIKGQINEIDKICVKAKKMINKVQ